MSFLHPQSAHNARLPRKVEFSSNVTTSSPDKKPESSDPNQFPMKGSAQIAGSRKKVPVGPGHSAMDWGRLKASETNLRGGVTALQRYTPSELAQHNTVEDMWMAFQGKIYCCTHYLAYHPGGVSQLMRGAGKDATELFMKVHPWVNMEYIMGDKCLVGYLIPENMKQTATLSAHQPKPATKTSAESTKSSSRTSSPIEFKIPASRATPKETAPSNTNTATLTSTKQISSTISTFTFTLETPVRHLPGSYAVFDFSAALNRPEYAHWKAQSRHQKDDFSRTWTISSAPPISEKVPGTFDKTTHVSCTIKRDGLMSSFLHSLEKGASLKVPVTDVGGVFSCFDKHFGVKPPPKKLLLIAGGVGVTPFLAMIEALAARLQRDGKNAECDVSFMFSAHGDDVRVLDGISRDIVKRLSIFDSTAREDKFYNAGGASGVESFARRIREDDLVATEGLLERECFVCGPLEFMKDVKRWLFQAGVDPKRVHDESFMF
ncbi:hypothetical protein HDU81_008332 [Chytriomyces hyalinus]|nr:hypothetical protein HDU81_008332 [Chytriomyces hyalinus]